MKKLFTLICAAGFALTSAGIFSSCNEVNNDEGDGGRDSYLTTYGKTYSLPNEFYYGTSTQTDESMIFNCYMEPTNAGWPEFQLYMGTTAAAAMFGPQEGTYTVGEKNDEGILPLFTIDKAQSYLRRNIYNEPPVKTFITGGTVKVTNFVGFITMEFDLTDEAGQAVKGRIKATIQDIKP